MRVGTVREIKNHEYRVGLTPGKRPRADPRTATRSGSRPARGSGSAPPTSDYRAAGAAIQADAAAVFAGCEMIVKVKEPQPEERALLREGQVLYTYLHLAPDPEQTADLLRSRASPRSPMRR